MVKKNDSHNMTVFYPNLCYSEVYYQGIALYRVCSIGHVTFSEHEESESIDMQGPLHGWED